MIVVSKHGVKSGWFVYHDRLAFYNNSKAMAVFNLPTNSPNIN